MFTDSLLSINRSQRPDTASLNWLGDHIPPSLLQEIVEIEKGKKTFDKMPALVYRRKAFLGGMLPGSFVIPKA